MPGRVDITDTGVDVLLIEDDDGDALLVTDGLAELPVPPAVARARSIKEAVRLLDDDRTVSCAVLDLGLPDYQGLDALRALRERAPELPVVVLTGHADEHEGIQALSAGAQDYLVKGAVDGRILARAIRYAIERGRAEQAQVELREAAITARENTRLERGLLPRPLILDGGARIGAVYRPGRQRALLGGDFYDIVECPDGHTRMMIGDVCGHGPDEAALGASLRIAWRTLILNDADDDQVLPTLDRVLVNERHAEGIFATVADLRIDPDRKRFSLRLAGHPTPLQIGHGAVKPLARQVGVPIGLGEAAWWPVDEGTLDPGAALLLFTDGLIEGRIGEGPERLGMEGLRDLLSAAIAEPGWDDDLDAFIAGIIDRVEELNGGAVTDDIATLLVAWP